MNASAKNKVTIIYFVLIIVDIAAFFLNKIHYIYALYAAFISLFTFLFHFTIRFSLANYILSLIQTNCSYEKWWFREKPFEKKLYKILNVKKWKGHLPTWNDKDFVLNQKDKLLIVKHMCEAEAYHEICALLSFIPLLFSLIWGKFYIFLFTSLGGAVFDLLFALIQRYNRPRLLKLILRRNEFSLKKA